MWAYKPIYTNTALRDIKKLGPPIRRRIKNKLELYYSQKDPLIFAERLTKPRDAQYRWRIGSYRVLFDVEKDKIIILRVQHRREIYRK